MPPKAGPSWKAFKGWSCLEGLQRLVIPEGLQRLVLPGRPSKAGHSWKAFKGWSFLEGLQRLVLPGRPSEAGPSFKGWSCLEGLQRLVIPGRPSHPHFCFFFNIHFFSLDWRLPTSSRLEASPSSSRNRIFFAPLPQQARVPPKRERKRKYVTPARKVFCFQSL